MRKREMDPPTSNTIAPSFVGKVRLAEPPITLQPGDKPARRHEEQKQEAKNRSQNRSPTTSQIRRHDADDTMPVVSQVTSATTSREAARCPSKK